MDHRRKLLALLIVVPLFGGCSSLVPPSDIKAPTLGLTDLSIKELGLSEVRFTALVAANNPNKFSLPLSDTRLELFLMGQSIATGFTQNAKMELAASQATQVPVEFAVSTSKVLGLLKQVTRAQWSQLSYQIKGEAKWGALGLPMNFDKKGDLDAFKKLSELIR
jgi:LEA14-like dessication related protein